MTQKSPSLLLWFSYDFLMECWLGERVPDESHIANQWPSSWRDCAHQVKSLALLWRSFDSDEAGVLVTCVTPIENHRKTIGKLLKWWWWFFGKIGHNIILKIGLISESFFLLQIGQMKSLIHFWNIKISKLPWFLDFPTRRIPYFCILFYQNTPKNKRNSKEPFRKIVFFDISTFRKSKMLTILEKTGTEKWWRSV